MSSRVALVVGIGSSDKDAPLKYCPPSAKKVYDLLISSEYGDCDKVRSLLITDEKIAVFESDLDQIIKNKLKEITPDETFIFYYIGHASASVNNVLFLETHQAKKTEDGYRLSNLIMEIRDRGIKEAILIVDACASGLALETLEQSIGKFDRKIAILASSERYDFSYQDPSTEWSVFSFFFCEGIQQGCEGNAHQTDEVIDVAMIKNYINRRIPQDGPLTAKKQRASAVISEGPGKLWLSRIPKERPPGLSIAWEGGITKKLKTFHDLYHNGSIIPEKCEEVASTLRTIQDILKDYSQGNQVVLNMLLQQLSVLINYVSTFRNHCQDVTEYSTGLRENIVELLTDILRDLEHL